MAIEYRELNHPVMDTNNTDTDTEMGLTASFWVDPVGLLFTQAELFKKATRNYYRNDLTRFNTLMDPTKDILDSLTCRPNELNVLYLESCGRAIECFTRQGHVTYVLSRLKNALRQSESDPISFDAPLISFEFDTERLQKAFRLDPKLFRLSQQLGRISGITTLFRLLETPEDPLPDSPIPTNDTLTSFKPYYLVNIPGWVLHVDNVEPGTVPRIELVKLRLQA